MFGRRGSPSVDSKLSTCSIRTAITWTAIAVALLAARASAHAQPTTTAPLSDGEFRACVDRLALQTSAAGRPLTRSDFERITRDAKYQDRVRIASSQQTLEPTLLWDDLAARVDA